VLRDEVPLADDVERSRDETRLTRRRQLAARVMTERGAGLRELERAELRPTEVAVLARDSY
jgi:hypothetical protein